MLDGKPDILLVDDDRDGREVLRRILESLGYAVREAANGAEGLKEVERRHPEAVLLDVNMPVKDGFETCRELKSGPETKLIPVVLLTAMDGREERLKGLKLGADGFLGKPYDVAELTTRLRALVALKQHTDQLEQATRVVLSLARVVDQRDQQTGDHCRRVGELAAGLGAALGLDQEAQAALRLGGQLHDIGKVGIPDAVLCKPGRLDEAEMAVIRAHPLLGAELLAPLRTLAPALPLIRHHHERLDGTGYPDGLSGDAIPLTVRVLSVTDIYDVLSTKRPYKDPLPMPRCFAILREECARGWWDPRVVDALEELVAGKRG